MSTYRKARCRALCQSQHYSGFWLVCTAQFPVSKLEPPWLNDGSNTAVPEMKLPLMSTSGSKIECVPTDVYSLLMLERCGTLFLIFGAQIFQSGHELLCKLVTSCSSTLPASKRGHRWSLKQLCICGVVCSSRHSAACLWKASRAAVSNAGLLGVGPELLPVCESIMHLKWEQTHVNIQCRACTQMLLCC